VNKSEHYFIPEGENEIRFGLLGIKNVGLAAVEEILKTRATGGPFSSFQDFLLRVNDRVVNKKVTESLIRAGLLIVWAIGKVYCVSFLPG